MRCRITICRICPLFDCGSKCICICHIGTTDKIKHNLSPDSSQQLQQITKEDIRMVAQQVGVNFETARRYLKKHNGDLAKAILDIGTGVIND